MANVEPKAMDLTATKKKALLDAQKAQAAIARECADAGRAAPPFVLDELIGKGSFGRVYKASDTAWGRPVAVKIISIEEGDALQPGTADTFGDILKEISTLQLLSNSNARNINKIIHAFLVGQSVWMVTDYCAGGSVASLMRPTNGLAERWVIPILREVAEAIYWVHGQGIIHRDIKCANVLVTDTGAVQLCDFGVAGIMETRFDKRSTVTGTLNWMAPELFDSTVSYGMEVDIWAFGSMAYEMASGLPPNAATTIDSLPSFGSFLKQFCPRLDGQQYSDGLKHLIAFCMVDDPVQRPTIARIQEHPYIFNTQLRYPIESLAHLVSAYRLWETQGWSRQSLFSAGGAQGLSKEQSPTANDEWNFSDQDQPSMPDEEASRQAQQVYDAYLPDSSVSSMPSSGQPARRRRRPPTFKELKGPLQKVFDPDTTTNYHDDSRVFYGKRSASCTSDLPLRDNTQETSVRESLIDLDAALSQSPKGNTIVRLAEIDTIRPASKQMPSSTASSAQRRTQDWTFPLMGESSAGLDSNEEGSNNDLVAPLTLESAQQLPAVDEAQTFPNRSSSLSLIDLDASLVQPTEVARPSTAGSSIGSNTTHHTFRTSFDTIRTEPYSGVTSPTTTRPSTAGSHATSSSSVAGSAVFDLELDTQHLPVPEREASLYQVDQVATAEAATGPGSDEANDDAIATPSQDNASTRQSPSFLPPLPRMPSAAVLQGNCSVQDFKLELQHLVSSLRDHLEATSHCLEGLQSPAE
ncbi:hypothetical protein CDD81_6033 [Ophiocordyceps australis]|uniref:non-specific serine/threonine protein kinase n=1 Tax=Ophiocordyceps australis TaxID=1399860 RepID=A0A2C5Y6K2_9HYPO|nr:hypothetical protein CDD81_6033 [Ophiocordyceps australis]